MSVITEVILATAMDDGYLDGFQGYPMGTVHNVVNVYLEKEYGCRLKNITCSIGGNKCSNVALWVGAFDPFDTEDFLKSIVNVKFQYPECVNLLIKEDNEDNFTDFGPIISEPEKIDAMIKIAANKDAARTAFEVLYR